MALKSATLDESASDLTVYLAEDDGTWAPTDVTRNESTVNVLSSAQTYAIVTTEQPEANEESNTTERSETATDETDQRSAADDDALPGFTAVISVGIVLAIVALRGTRE